VQVNESVVTGESIPVHKKMNDILIGGSLIDSGTAKAYVSAAGEDSVMQKLVRMMQHAQGEKPPVQLLTDKISAWFVPTVVGIAVATLLISYFFFSISFSDALMRSIAVLVISCPCAMGLATPAAIAVGLGRAARNGILVRNAKSLEQFSHIKQMVFDKTGTLTTGQLRVEKWHSTIDEKSFFQIIYSLEKFSNHPIGKALALHGKTNELIKWQKIVEVKGEGMHATDKDGNSFKAVKYGAAKALTNEAEHSVYVLRNDQLIGWVDVADEMRPEAKEVIAYCKRKNIKTILLSGDTQSKCVDFAQRLGIDEVFAEHTPEQKLNQIARLNGVAPTVMIGDGINDAPALAKATIGISLSDATQLAMQTADVVLTKKGLGNLPMAMELGQKTYGTIKSNLFWAFAYNIIAIPIAALGLLTPTFAALAMALSDVVLAVNSLWLNYKRV
jgi:P-type Cu+ transporter